MTNGLVLQVAMLAVSMSILICAFFLYRKRKVQPEPLPRVPPARPSVERSQNSQPKAAPMTAIRKSDHADREPPRTVAMSTDSTGAQFPTAVNSPPAGVRKAEAIDMQGALITDDDRNERILAGISENIRKTLQLRQQPNHSPILYSEVKPRNTEYVRVKKEIITPHGHIRFSILKDWMSTNMLAVFRRASLEWKTPEDLIAFLPAYLEADAEILNNEVLLVGTSGHNEKLAVPIRNLDAVHLRECFDFVSGGRAAANTPAVLLPIEAGFEIVSKGVIAQSIFSSADPVHAGMKVLGETSADGLQRNYSVALLPMECAVVTDGVNHQSGQR